MSVAVCPSETPGSALQRIRVDGGVKLAFAAGHCGTYCARVAESDGHRARVLPTQGRSDVVLLNTGGGIAGGDRVRFEASLGPGTDAQVTTVAAERIYRSSGLPARMDVSMSLGAGSRLAWLPQETILYSGARLQRRIDIAMAASATITLLDIVVLGRRGSGEVMQAGAWEDRWTVRRSGRMVHMEAVRMSGAVGQMMQRQATGGGAHVIGTLLHVADDAVERLDAVRAVLPADGSVEVAASAWDRRLVVRGLGASGDAMRRAFAAITTTLTHDRMPRVWAT
jgi:urease accessory protein